MNFYIVKNVNASPKNDGALFIVQNRCDLFHG